MNEDNLHGTAENGTASSDNPTASWEAVDPTGVIERAGYWLTCSNEILGWYYGMVYQGHTMSRKPAGWLLIMRATKKGKKMVAFSAGETPVECIRTFAWACKHGNVQWREDLY